MARYVYRRDDLPPDDAPWLISSVGDLRRDLAERAVWRERWAATYPKGRTTYAQKVAWAESVQFEEDAQLQLDRSRPVCEREVLADILYDDAPDTLVLQILIPRRQLARLELASAAMEVAFLAAAETDRPGRAARTAKQRGFAAYRDWLAAERSTGTAFRPRAPRGSGGAPPDDHVLLAQRACARDARTEDAVLSLLRDTGLHGLGATPEAGDEPVELLGQMLHFAEPAAPSGVAVAVRLRGHKAAQPTAFDRRIHAAEADAAAPRSCLFLPRALAGRGSDDDDSESGSGSDEERAPTSMSDATHLILTVAAGYAKEVERMESHVQQGKGEANSIRQRLNKGNTDTGNLQLSVLTAEFAAIKDERCPTARKLMRTLCLLNSMTSGYPLWLHDTEFFDEVPGFVAEVATYLRTNLLKKSDEQLGIGIEGPDGHNAGAGGPDDAEPSEARKALHLLLDKYKKQLEQEDEDVRFTWLARKRARRSSDGGVRNVRGG